jgi:hypothetical protein
MHHVEGCDRDQAQLLPARVDDYVHRDNPVRFIDAFVDDLYLNIDAFVDDLDLNEAGFALVEPKDSGRPVTIRPTCSSFTFMATSIGCAPVAGLRLRPRAISR